MELNDEEEESVQLQSSNPQFVDKGGGSSEELVAWHFEEAFVNRE